MLKLPSATRVEVGVDECGRGCLYGVVVAAACILPADLSPDDALVPYIKDSKKLTEKKRTEVAKYIKEKALAYGIGEGTVEEIDTINILQANFRAMHRALDQVYEKLPFEHILVDGPHFKRYIKPNTNPPVIVPYTAIPQGDAEYMNIAAASILAKTYRDAVIVQMVADNPALDKYGLKSNKGYGTKKHMDALKEHGATPYHRKSFAPVAAALKNAPIQQ
jgi:ribonuclease HII